MKHTDMDGTKRLVEKEVQIKKNKKIVYKYIRIKKNINIFILGVFDYYVITFKLIN